MSNIDKISKEALREVAEDAQKAHKWEGLENGLKADGYVSTTVRFIQRASPQTVLALLDELEAAEKKTVEMPTFDGYVPHVARELQAAFRIACDNAGINVAAAAKGE
ncbi:ead/Ea22-like family protein [Enterobacter hormaechei]|uniref:ead/Ea22-like family protein n=1 Tax=Enterobacter hormaechei TaxID=158836 RepID=UPI0025B43311|nr:ead/Ea22-like family protein [Enterobacter hormaechei]MDN3773881.1 ead/Ea22-like family protein [Enterobacter hormaechei]MDN3805739.1 ead/Ea22-like family protein [Enterobacter hormaechei]MDN3823629.1 ead/Ea22-like family protein [Enterobacter hormaechei]